MKALQTLVPWIVLAASALGFVIGWSWDSTGRQFQEDYPNDWELKVLGHVISNVGNILECVGGIGVLSSIALFSAMQQLKGFKRRIRLLEAEVDRLRRAMLALSTASPCSDAEKSGDVRLPLNWTDVHISDKL